MELSGGVITSVTFHNEDNGFSVVKVQFGNALRPVTCVGSMPSIAPGREISVSGHWESSRRFGKQFVVEHYSLSAPTTKDGIITFLSSGVLPNIGPARARQIYELFGAETLAIMDQAPERLIEIPGIGTRTVKKIREKWLQDEQIRNLLLFLQQFDVSYGMAVKIYKVYGGNAQEKISKNPYTLCEDIWGIGFLKADRIAQHMGFSHDSYKRIRAGIIYVINEATQEGHTCLPVAELKKRTVELLNVSEDRFVFSLDHATAVKMLIIDGENVYLPHLFNAEKAVALMIRRKSEMSLSHHRNKNIFKDDAATVTPVLSAGTEVEPTGSVKQCDVTIVDEVLTEPVGENRNQKADGSQFDEWLDSYERENKWRADPAQRRAIKTAIGTSCMLLTGGPGTGKTTVLKVMVNYFQSKNKKILLTAPTGRAAQRMKEVTGIPAQTVHRLLEYQPQTKRDGMSFKRNEQNPLDGEVVIVDEVSMMDILLMSYLCKALPVQSHLVLVGDHDQLPSVGPGNVLWDLIASRLVPHIHLTSVFRQASSSRIITAAHEINSGLVPLFRNGKNENCFFIDSDDPDATLSLLIDLVSRRLPSSFLLDPLHDIQVLSPMHKGILGTENLNNRLQESLRRSSGKIETGQTVFYQGDKVMQIKNNYDKNVFNGDIGFVKEIIDDSCLLVDFQGNSVLYEHSSLEELLPAYCISIHKSQGSEFNAVVIPLVTQHYIMLQRNLLYTALTRAKMICVFIGSRKALKIAVTTNNVAVRYSCLKNRLLESGIH